ncbi:MAG: histidine kinase [Bacteroidales bacterium]
MKAVKLIPALLILAQVQAFTWAGIPDYHTTADVKNKKVLISSVDTSVVNKLTTEGYKFVLAFTDARNRGFMYLTKYEDSMAAKACIDSAVAICEINHLKIPSKLYLLMAEYNFITGDFRSASEEAAKAMIQSAANDEKDILARTYIFLGVYYENTKSFKASIEYLNNGITIAGKEKLKGLIPWAYFYRANVFEAVGDLRSSRENLQLMIDEGLNENDFAAVARGYSMYGTSYCGDSATSAKRDFRKARSLLKKGLEFSFLNSDTGQALYSLANTGWNYYLEKMHDSALFYYEISLKYSLPMKIYTAAANSLGNIGTIYRDLNKPAMSISYYQQAIEQGKKVNDVYNLQWIYNDMAQMYLREKDTANAFISYVQYKKYSDMLLNKANNQGLADARMQYEADTRNKEMQLLSLKVKNQRLLNFGFAGFFILALAIGILLFGRSKLESKRRLSELNRKVSEMNQANLRQQMNPHFIFNTLNSIQYYMYQHDRLATNNYLTKFSSLMRKVLDNSQHTSIPLSDELGALKLYLELEAIRFRDKFDFKISVDDEIDPIMFKVPTMLIQPYVENSICHGIIPAESKGYVDIDLKLNNNCIVCTIEDNGIGRDASRERNLKKERNHTSLGTHITKSRLDLVNELYGTSLKTTYTDLKNENGEPAGTRVEIHIPILA